MVLQPTVVIICKSYKNHADFYGWFLKLDELPKVIYFRKLFSSFRGPWNLKMKKIDTKRLSALLNLNCPHLTNLVAFMIF